MKGDVGSYGDQPEALIHVLMMIQCDSPQAVFSKDRITVDSEEEQVFHQHGGP